MPIYRGLVGPIPEGTTAVRYESPEVFEALTKEWTKLKAKRRRRRSAKEMAEAAAAEAEALALAGEEVPAKAAAATNAAPAPKFPFGAVKSTPSVSQSLSNS